MKTLIKTIFLILMAACILASAVSCGNKDSSDDQINVSGDRSPEEKKMASDVFDSLTNMYSYLNSGDYESYISYWDIEEDDKNLMLESFKAMGDIATLNYELESVDVIMVSENRCNVTAITKETSTSKATGNATIIRETMYYVMEKVDDSYHIKTYSSGGNELVEYAPSTPETTEADG